MKKTFLELYAQEIAEVGCVDCFSVDAVTGTIGYCDGDECSRCLFIDDGYIDKNCTEQRVEWLKETGYNLTLKERQFLNSLDVADAEIIIKEGGGIAYGDFNNNFKIDHLKFNGVPKNIWFKVYELL